MKRLLVILAFSVISVTTLHAQTSTQDDKTGIGSGKLPEPSALILASAGVGIVGLWLRNRK